MKSIHVTFTDEEMKKLKKVKNMSWHDWIMTFYYIHDIKFNGRKNGRTG